MMTMTAVVPMLVVAAPPVPSVMMATSPVPSMMVAAPSMELVSVTVATPMLDLDQGSVLNGQRSNGYSCGSGCGHGKRSNKGGADQNDTSHAGILLNRVIAMSDTISRRRVLFRYAESKLSQRFLESDC
jgi:hypothetical protein